MSEAESETESTDPNATTEPLVRVEPAALTSDQLEDLKNRAAKADEHWDRLLRATAEFDNFRKRAAREKQEAIKYANESLISKLLTVLDNFEMAMAAAQNGPSDKAQPLQTGVTMIHQQLKAVLTDAGLEEINAAGQLFDPLWHEAVAQQETADAPEGTVLQQLRKGYKLRDRLLRPASVVVAKALSVQAARSE